MPLVGLVSPNAGATYCFATRRPRLRAPNQRCDRRTVLRVIALKDAMAVVRLVLIRSNRCM
jgi:hypothetical protein